MPKSAATSSAKPRTSRMAKLALKIDSVVDKLKTVDNRTVAKAVTSLESIKDKMSASKSGKKSTKELSPYNKFVKNNWNHKDLTDLSAPEKMKKLGAMWAKTKKNAAA
jgi:hypothetical protein